MAGLLVASLYGTLDLEDNFTPKLTDAEKNAQKFGKTMGNTEDAARSFGAALGSLPIAGLFLDAIKQASEYEDSVTQLDAALKSTGAQMSQAAQSQGQWVTSTDLSGKAQAKLQGQIDSANKTLDNQIRRTELMGTTSKGAAVSIEMQKEKISGLNDELTKGTQKHTVWVASNNQVGSSAHFSEKALLDYADSMSKVTKYSDETVISSEAMLLTFTKIGADTFPAAETAILDVSTAMKQDLKQSTIEVGKALNDPITGLTALKRIGVTFSDEQVRMIKNFTNTNQLAKAQGVIIGELNREFGKSAEAAGNTFSGKMAILNNTFNDFLKVAGQQAIPVLGLFASVLTTVTGALQNADPAFLQIGMALGAIALLFSPMAAGILAMLGPLALVAGAAVALGLAWTNNWGGIRTTVEGVIHDVTPMIQTFANVAQSIWGALDPGSNPATVAVNRPAGHGFTSSGGAKGPSAPGTMENASAKEDFATKFQANMAKLKVPSDISKGLVDVAQFLQNIGPAGDVAAAGIVIVGLALAKAGIAAALNGIVGVAGAVVSGFLSIAASTALAALPFIALAAGIGLVVYMMTHLSDVSSTLSNSSFGKWLQDAVLGPLEKSAAAMKVLTDGVKTLAILSAGGNPGGGGVAPNGTPAAPFTGLGNPVNIGASQPEVKPKITPPTVTDYNSAMIPFLQQVQNTKAPPVDIKTPTQANVGQAGIWLQTDGSVKIGGAASSAMTEAGKAVAANPAIQTNTQASFTAATTWIKGDGTDAAKGATTAMVGSMSGIMAGAGGPLVESVRGALLEIAKMFGGLPNNVGGQVAAQIQAAAKRAGGGDVIGGGLYEVGEGNQPELLKSGGKQFLIPGNNGSIIGNRDLLQNANSNRALLASGRGQSQGGDLHIHGLVLNGVQDVGDFFSKLQAHAKTKNMTLGNAIR